ncbi:MAG: hypothetical protein IPL87_05110 [Candidatus Moraniibacteriota bacterium]|nr:MAG: hypothetical protein IPL87_05110 [Candidatus Moranbacteria bacterium]
MRNRQALERIDIETKLSEQKEQNELQKLLEIALSSSDTSLQRTGARFISSLEEAARREFCEKLSNSLVEMSLSSDTKKHLVLAEIIRHNSEYIPLEKIKDRLTSLLERDLGSKDISVQEVGVKIIELLPESADKRHYESKLREWLLQKILSQESQEQINAARLLGFTSHEILFELGEKILHGDNEEAKEITARYIKRLDPLKSVPLLRLTFNTKSLQLKKIGAEATTRLFRTHNKQPKVPLFITSAITETVRASLESDDRNIQRIGSEMLKDVTNTKDLIDLVRLGVNSNDRTVKLNAIAAIRFIDTRFDFGKRAMSDFIEQALQSEDTNIQRVAITISRHVPEPEKDKCMNQAFALVSKLVNSENRASQKRGTEMMYYINHPKIETLFSEKIEPDQELLNILLFSRLYPDHESASKFSG